VGRPSPLRSRARGPVGAVGRARRVFLMCFGRSLYEAFSLIKFLSCSSVFYNNEHQSVLVDMAKGVLRWRWLLTRVPPVPGRGGEPHCDVN
jgi:hypothetical protein